MQFLKNISLAISFILCLLLSSDAVAQQSSLGNWFSYFGNHNINDKWNWAAEVQYRNYNFIGDLEQLMFKTGIGYNLSENNNNLLLGYAFSHTEPYITNTDNKTKVSENRIYQQFITKQSFGRFFIQHKYRAEERFFHTSTQKYFRLRFRYFSSFNIPLNKKTIERNAVYLSGYNEIFINKKSPIFDRDRIYGGFGYGINKNFRIETGIMYQLFEKRNRPQWQIMLYNNTPFKKHS